MSITVHLDIINLYQCEKGFHTAERVFSFPYFLYVHKGKGIYKIGNTSYTGTIGDLFFCPPYVGNTIIADQEEPFLLSGIDCTIGDLSLEDQKDFDNLQRKMNILKNPFMIRTIDKMVKEYKTNRILSDEICNTLLKYLYLEMIRISKIGSCDYDNIQNQILSYLDENMNRTVTYSELSNLFPYHKSSIHRIITATTGLCLREYIIAFRIKKACEILEFSNRSFSETANLCGYNSAIFFSKQFKLKMGMSPRQYRKQKRATNTIQFN